MQHLRRLASYAVFNVIGFRPSPVPAAEWDREYREGRWDYLNGMKDLAGLVSVLGYCQFLKPASILDVGCGAGLLAQKLKVLDYQAYLGIDLSGEAIAQAAPMADARSAFAVAEAENFQTDRRFDVVIFSQILNYIHNPHRLLVRYASVLNPGGRIIVAMFNTGRTRAAWSLIGKTMIVEDAMTVNQVAGSTTTKVLKPRSV